MHRGENSSIGRNRSRRLPHRGSRGDPGRSIENTNQERPFSMAVYLTSPVHEAFLELGRLRNYPNRVDANFLGLRTPFRELLDENPQTILEHRRLRNNLNPSERIYFRRRIEFESVVCQTEHGRLQNNRNPNQRMPFRRPTEFERPAHQPISQHQQFLENVHLILALEQAEEVSCSCMGPLLRQLRNQFRSIRRRISRLFRRRSEPEMNESPQPVTLLSIRRLEEEEE